MRLKHKVMMMVALLLLLSLGMIVWIVKEILVESYNDIDEASARRLIQNVSKTLENDIATLSISMTNFSAWDDTYFFIQSNASGIPEDSPYLASNYTESTYTSNRINFVLLLDQDGQMRYGQYYDFVQANFHPIPSFFLDPHNIEDLSKFESLTDKQQGMLLVDGEPMIVISQPIVTSEMTGPPVGTMIVGRYFGENEQADLADRLDLPLDLTPMRTSADSTIKVEPISDTELRVTQTFPSMTGEAAFQLSTVQPRLVYVEGMKTINYILGVYLLIGAAAGTLGYRWTNNNIILRLRRIVRYMKRIESTSDFQIRLPLSGKDEIGSLEGMFNNMMVALESSQQSLIKHASTDPLTKLANRAVFFAELERSIRKAGAKGDKLAVLFLDLDHFKKVNDTYGHDAGDCLLVEVSARLQGCVRKQDLVSRLAGDEFTVLLRDYGDVEEVHQIIERIRRTLRKPIAWDGRQILVTASIGYSLYPEFGGDAERLVQNADRAMYIVKANGRDEVQPYTDEIRSAQDAAEKYEVELWGAVSRGEMHLEYQPIVHLESGEMLGMETLVRWNHPEFGSVPPAVFIPIAERTGSILPIGRWVLEQACADLKSLRDLHDGLYVSVNISPRQLKQYDFVEVSLDIITQSGVEAGRLYFEITETELMTDLDITTSKLQALRDSGVKISIDDFGTGYSSLAYLKKLPLDALKIDKSFIDRIDTKSTDQQIARMIISLGELLGLNIIAEGIENEVQVDVLIGEQCQYGQGYFYSKPRSVEDLRTFMEVEQMLSNSFQ